MLISSRITTPLNNENISFGNTHRQSLKKLKREESSAPADVSYRPPIYLLNNPETEEKRNAFLAEKKERDADLEAVEDFRNNERRAAQDALMARMKAYWAEQKAGDSEDNTNNETPKDAEKSST